MEISYYELLGMIKDNKNPKKVVYEDKVYIWNYKDYQTNSGSYITTNLHENEMFSKDIIILDSVEIIEEDKEIEELCIEKDLNSNNYYLIDKDSVKCQMTRHSRIIANKLNEVIKELNKIMKEGK